MASFFGTLGLERSSEGLVISYIPMICLGPVTR